MITKEGCSREEKQIGGRAVMWKKRKKDVGKAWFLRLERQL